MLSICTESMEKRKAPNWTIGRAKTCLTAEEAIREPILVADQRTRPSYLYFLKMISMSYYLAHISFCLGLGIYSYSVFLSRRWTLSFQLDLCGKLSISFKTNQRIFPCKRHYPNIRTSFKVEFFFFFYQNFANNLFCSELWQFAFPLRICETIFSTQNFDNFCFCSERCKFSIFSS